MQAEHRGVRAVQRLVEHAPASGGLALWVHHEDLPDDEPGAAPLHTDGRTIFYRPAFAALPLPLQAGWVAHQVLHVALRHAPRMREYAQRRGEVDAQLWNLCADAIVNSALGHLRWLELPAAAPRLHELLARVLALEVGTDAALAEWDVERLYAIVDDRAEGRKSGRDGPRAARLRALGQGTARDLFPAAGIGERPEEEAEATREWAERLLRAQAGDGPHALVRALLADLPRVRTPWEALLRTQCARALAQKPAPNWSRPTRSWIANRGRTRGGRRLPWEPGTTHAQRAPRLAVVLDVSGSIDDALLARFGAELRAITRRAEAGLVLVVGDQEVLAVRRFAPGAADLGGLPLPGGGGTDFGPLLAEAQVHDPDLIVVLTDLDGPAHVRPRVPVLWAVPEAKAGAAAPFGRVIVLR